MVVLEKICLFGWFGGDTDVMSFVLYLEGTYGNYVVVHNPTAHLC